MSDCGHLALIASGEGRGLCVLCQRAEIERLLNVIRYIDENGESDGGDAMAEYARRALEHKPR